MERLQQADLHGHSCLSAELFGYRPGYRPAEIIQKAKEIGLDAVALTDHDTGRGLDEFLNAAANLGVIGIPGIEITSLSWSRPTNFRLPIAHILALGIKPESINGKHPIPTGRTPEEVIDWIHDRGGLAIAAHPDRKYTSLSETEIRKLGNLNGLETLTLRGRIPEAELLARELEIAAIADTDFHDLRQMGFIGLTLLEECTNWETVISAIARNQIEVFEALTIPYHLRGRRPFQLLIKALLSR